MRYLGSLVLGFFLWFLLSASPSGAAEAPFRVLILHSYHAGFSWTDSINHGINEAFKAFGPDLQSYVEYLDTKRQPSSTYRSVILPELVRYKLNQQTFDLVIVSDNHAFDFALRHRQEFFPDVPLVFCGVNNFQPQQIEGSSAVTGVAEHPSFLDTLQTTQRLHPQVTDIIVIGSLKGKTGQQNRQLLAAAGELLAGQISLEYWDDLDAAEVTRRLQSLGPQHAVLLTSVLRSSAGQVYDFPATAQLVRKNCPVPVYGLWDFFLGHGIVGGKLVSGKEQGRLAGELGLKVLQGQAPEDLPVIYAAANTYLFDHRELDRFGVDPDSLPAQSQLIHAPSPFYEVRPEVARLTVAFVLSLLLLLGVLGVNIQRRRRSEIAYREQSQFLRCLIDAIPYGIFYKDREGRYLGCNAEVERILGVEQEAFIGRTVEELYPSDEAEVYRQADEELFVQGGTQVYEHTMTRQDGETLNVMFHKAVYRNAQGHIAGLVGSFLDISARKRAEEALLESERYNRMLFEQSPVGLMVHRLDGTLVDVNPAFARIMGRSDKELIGDQLSQYVPSLGAHELDTLMNQARTQGRFSPVENELLHLDGHSVPVLVSGMLFSRGEESLILSSVEDISIRQRANEALRQSEERFRTTFETSPDAICINRLTDGLYVEINQGFTDLTGYERLDALGKRSRDLGLWQERDRRRLMLDRLKEQGAVSNFEAIFQLKDGATATVLVSARIIEIGGEVMVLSVIKNIEDLKQSQASLRESEHKYRRIFEHIQDVYYESSLDGKVLEISPSVERNLGFQRDTLIGTSFNELYVDPKEREVVVSQLQKDGFIRDHEIWLRDQKGVERPCAISAILVHDTASGKTKIVGSLRDITERKTAEEETRKLAYYDTLTGLPNRSLFNDRLNQSLARSRRHGDLVAVLFLDLDRFKDVNDTRGHASGDLLLKLTAQRLKACIRQTDTVARLGGDEFVLLLNGIKSDREVLLIAQKVLRLMAAPMDLEGQEVFTTTSIGVVIAPMDGQDVDGLMKHADMAMYAAKAEGRNTYKFFSKEMNRKAMDRHAMEISLRRAIREEEFRLVYQPQIDLASGRMIGAEALLRWDDPHHGLVRPDTFIPVAEDTGLIRPIGEWVLQEACRQGKMWLDEGYPAIKIGVNLSGHQFKQADILDVIELALQTSKLPPGQLELELTESVLMENARETIAILTDLKIRGVKLAVDDFGTGYSSLSYLKNFPIDRIKIDRSFVMDITTDPNDAAIVETIIAMARSLGLRVIAEGVETQEQLEFLRSRQCNELQGYYLGKPMPADQITEFLKAGASKDGVCLFEGENRPGLH